jgi:cytochrome c oxidase assembly protein subunit 11
MKRNVRTGLLAGALGLGMAGVGYASVPLYRLFCEATGFGGTTQRASSAPGAVAGKTIVVRFDGNHDPALPWDFKPEQNRELVTLGEKEIAFFEATNNSDKTITGSASYNVTPTQAGAFFNKIACFCFKEQTLKPGQHVRMPVQFFVDPAIAKDASAQQIEEITLSYTFHLVDEGKKRG